MRKLNRLTAGAVCAVLAALLIVPASAHGHHGGWGHHSRRTVQSVQTTITVCPYGDCTIAGRHAHSGVTYCGYDHTTGVCDGACRALCAVEDCTVAGRHIHDGVTYCGYDHENGYCDGACRALCPYEDCTIAGAHTHDGVTYCGYHHADGYCGGHCAAGTVNSSYGYGCGRGGHHGCW